MKVSLNVLIKKVQRSVSSLLIFSILLPHSAALGQGFLGSIVGPPAPPASQRQPIVSLLVDQELLTSVDLVSRIDRYADDITKTLGADVVKIPLPRDVSPFEIFEGNAHLYYSGINDDSRSQLIGTVLIGEIPIPVVNKEGALWPSVFPYTDFVEPTYSWDFDRKQFFSTGKSQNAEIWHGVIKGTPNPDISTEDLIVQHQRELIEYFDANHLVHTGQKTYDEKVFFADIPTQKQSMSGPLAKMYQNGIKYLEDRLYYRYNAQMAQDFVSEMSEDITVPWDQLDPDIVNIPDEFPPDDMGMGQMPDIHTKIVIEKFVRNYLKTQERYLSLINELIGNAARWDGAEVETTISLVTQKDEMSGIFLKAFNDQHEEALINWVETNNIASKFDIETEFLDPIFDTNGNITGYNGFDLFHFGKRRSDIVSAEDCSIIRGSSPTTDAPYAQMVEANKIYNTDTIDTCYSHIGVTDNNPFSSITNDDLFGCCASNLEIDETTGEYSYDASTVDCVDWSANDVLSVSERLLLPGFPLRGPSQPVFDIAGTYLRPFVNGEQRGLQGAAACDAIAVHDPDPSVGAISSLVLHNEPRPETILAQTQNLKAKHLPIDDPRGFSFFDITDTYKKLYFFNIFELRSSNNVLTDAARHDALKTEIINQLQQKTDELNAIINNANSQSQFSTSTLPTTPYTYTLGGVSTTADIATIYHPILDEFSLDQLAEAIIWLDLDISKKNRLAFQNVLSPDEQFRWPVPNNLAGPDHSAKFFFEDSLGGYEFSQIIAEKSIFGGMTFSFENLQESSEALQEFEETQAQEVFYETQVPAAVPQFMGKDIGSQILGRDQITDKCQSTDFTAAIACYAQESFGNPQTTYARPDGIRAGFDEREDPTSISVSPSAAAISTRSVQPIEITVNTNYNGNTLTTDYESEITLEFSDPLTAQRLFRISPSKTQKVQEGEATFKLIPKARGVGGSFDVTAKSGTLSTSPVLIQVSESNLQATTNTNQVVAGSGETVEVEIQIVDEDNQRITTGNNTVSLSSTNGNLSTSSLTLNAGVGTFTYTPGTKAETVIITIDGQNSGLPKIEIPVEITPAEPTQISRTDNVPFILPVAEPTNLRFAITDQFGNPVQSVSDIQGAGADISWNIVEGIETQNNTDNGLSRVGRPNLSLSVRDANPAATTDTDLIINLGSSVTSGTNSLSIPLIRTASILGTPTSINLEAGDTTEQTIDLSIRDNNGAVLPINREINVTAQNPLVGLYDSIVEFKDGRASLSVSAGTNAGNNTLSLRVPGVQELEIPITVTHKLSPPFKVEIIPERTELKFENDSINIDVRLLDSFGNVATTSTDRITFETSDVTNTLTTLSGTGLNLVDGKGTFQLSSNGYVKDGTARITATANDPDVYPATAEIEVTHQFTPSDIESINPRSLFSVLLGFDGYNPLDETSFGLSWIASPNTQAVSTLIQNPEQKAHLGYISPDGEIQGNLTPQIVYGRYADVLLLAGDDTPVSLTRMHFDVADVQLAISNNKPNTVGAFVVPAQTETQNVEVVNNTLLFENQALFEISTRGGVTPLLDGVSFQPKKQFPSINHYDLYLGGKYIGEFYLIGQASSHAVNINGTIPSDWTATFTDGQTDAPYAQITDTDGNTQTVKIGLLNNTTLTIASAVQPASGVYYIPTQALRNQRRIDQDGNTILIDGSPVFTVLSEGGIQDNNPDLTFELTASNSILNWNLALDGEDLGQLSFVLPEQSSRTVNNIETAGGFGILVQRNQDDIRTVDDGTSSVVHEQQTQTPWTHDVKAVTSIGTSRPSGIEIMPANPHIELKRHFTGNSTADDIGIVIIDTREDAPLNQVLGSSRISAEDTGSKYQFVWKTEWKPGTLFAAGNTIGESTKVGASDIVVTLGDPTLSVNTLNSRNPQQVPEDIGLSLWKSSYGDIQQILSVDINGDAMPDIALQVADELHGLYHDPDSAYQFRDVGPILRFKDGLKGELVKQDNDGDNFWSFVQLSEENKIVLHENQNGKFLRVKIDNIPAQKWVDMKGGDFDNDGYTDLVLLDETNTIYIAKGKSNERFEDLQTLDQFTPGIEAVFEDFEVPAEAPDPLANIPQNEQRFAQYVTDNYPSFRYVGYTELYPLPLPGFLDIVMMDHTGGLYLLPGLNGAGTEFNYPQVIEETDPIHNFITSQFTLPDLSAVTDPIFLGVKYPNLSNTYVYYESLGDDVDLQNYWNQVLSIPDFLPQDVVVQDLGDISQITQEITQTPYVPVTFNKSLDVTLALTPQAAAGVTPYVQGSLSFRSDKTIDDLRVVLPIMGALTARPETLTCVGCDNTITTREIDGIRGLIAEGLNIPANTTLTLNWELEIPAGSPVGLSVQMHQSGGHKLVVPWEDNNGNREIVTFYDGLRTVEPIEMPTIKGLDDVPEFSGMTPEEVAEEMGALLSLDSDGDNIPDVYDDFPTVDQSQASPGQGFGDVTADFAEQKKATKCSSGPCSAELPIPSISFLTPGNRSIYIPPMSFPGPPTPGLPVFWAPPPPYMPSHMGSFFRLYVSPTTTGRVGMAACALNFNGFSQPMMFPTCIGAATPAIQLPGFCPAPDVAAGVTVPEPEFSPSPIAPCSTGQIANTFDGDASAWNSSQIDTQAQSPLSSDNGHKQTGGADFITTWVMEQFREITSFKIPEIRIITPNVGNGASLLKVTPRAVNIPYPEFPAGTFEDLGPQIAQWNQEMDGFIGNLRTELADYQQSVAANLPRIENILTQKFQDWQARGLLDPAADVSVLIGNYMAQLNAIAGENIKDIEDYIQAGLNLKTQIKVNQQSLASYKLAIQQIQLIPEQINEIQNSLSNNKDQIMEFVFGWIEETKQAIMEWIGFRDAVLGVIEAMTSVPDIFRTFTVNCVRCEVERGKSSDFILRIILGSIKLPIFPMPKLPDIVLDLTELQVGMEVYLPELTLTPVEIGGIDLPSLPAPPSLPNIQIPPIDDSSLFAQIGGNIEAGFGAGLDAIGDPLVDASQDLSGQIQGATPDPNLDPGTLENLSLPNIDPATLDLNELIGVPVPEINLPPLPNIPELPEIVIPDINVEVPSLDLPKLPSIPEPPFTLENIYEPLQVLIQILKFIVNLFCLLTMGITPLDEWDMSSGIERMTNRTIFIPFDLSFPALNFPKLTIPVKPIVIKPELDMTISLEEFNQLIDTTAQDFNCLMDKLTSSNKGGVSDGNCAQQEGENIIGYEIPDFSSLPKKETVIAINESVITQEFAEEMKEGKDKLQSLIAQVEDLEKATQINPHEQMDSGVVSESLYALNLQPKQYLAQAGQTIVDPSLLPTQIPNDEAFLNPETEIAQYQANGLAMCDPNSGLSLPLNAYDSRGQTLKLNYLKPDYHISEGTHPYYGSALTSCGAEGVEILHSVGGELYLKSCAAQQQRRVAGDIYGSLSTNQTSNTAWTTQRFLRRFTPVSTLSPKTEIDEIRFLFERLDPSIPYYEWVIDDRPDSVYELEDNLEDRTSELWERHGFLMRKEARKYEIRPMTTRVQNIVGTPRIFAPEATSLPTFDLDQCTNGLVSKPFFDEKSVLVGIAAESQMEIRTPARPNQPEEIITIVLRAGEETMVDSAEVCLTRGEVDVIGSGDVVEVQPRNNFYLPDGTRFEMGENDSLEIVLFDGSVLKISENEDFYMNLFDDSDDRIKYIRELPQLNHYGAFFGVKKNEKSLVLQRLLHDPQMKDDAQGPKLKIKGGKTQNVSLFAPIEIDAQGSSDNNNIIDVWWDFLPEIDENGDGDPANDRHFPLPSEAGNYTPEQLLKISLPEPQTLDSVLVGLNAQDPSENTSQQIITINVVAPDITLLEASARTNDLHGYIAPIQADVPLTLKRERNGQTSLIRPTMLTQNDGTFRWNNWGSGEDASLQDAQGNTALELSESGRPVITGDLSFRVSASTSADPLQIVLTDDNTGDVIGTVDYVLDGTRAVILTNTIDTTSSNIQIQDRNNSDDNKWEFYGSTATLINTTNNEVTGSITPEGFIFLSDPGLSLRLQPSNDIDTPMIFDILNANNLPISSFSIPF